VENDGVPILWPFDIFMAIWNIYGYLAIVLDNWYMYVHVNWYMFLLIGICSCQLVYVLVNWYIFPALLAGCAKKNLATLK
jgi:hypothetical protein